MTKRTLLPAHCLSASQKGKQRKPRAACGQGLWRLLGDCALRGAGKGTSFSLWPLLSGHDQIILNTWALCGIQWNLFSKFYTLHVFSNDTDAK